MLISGYIWEAELQSSWCFIVESIFGCMLQSICLRKELFTDAVCSRYSV